MFVKSFFAIVATLFSANAALADSAINAQSGNDSLGLLILLAIGLVSLVIARRHNA